MDALRAYTKIETGSTAIGNDWIERRWSSFLGTTTELLHGRRSCDWLTRTSEEFCFAVSGGSIGSLDFGEIEWSEERSPFGAALVCRRSGEGMVLSTRTIAFDQVPGLCREVRLLNCTGDTLEVSDFKGEILPIMPEALATRCAVPVASLPDVDCLLQVSVTTMGDYGLFLGTEVEGRREILDADAEYYATGLAGTHIIRAGEQWRLPDSFLVPFQGSVESAAGRELSSFLHTRKKMKDRESEIREAAKTGQT
jgi:hypothetical protein